MSLHAHPELGERLGLVVGERRQDRLVLRQLPHERPSLRPRLDRRGLGVDLPGTDREGPLLDDVPIRRDAPADDCLAEPECPFDDDPVGRPARRIDREHHARSVDLQLTLHDDRDVHLGLPESPLRAVEHRPRAEQG